MAATFSFCCSFSCFCLARRSAWRNRASSRFFARALSDTAVFEVVVFSYGITFCLNGFVSFISRTLINPSFTATRFSFSNTATVFSTIVSLQRSKPASAVLSIGRPGLSLTKPSGSSRANVSILFQAPIIATPSGSAFKIASIVLQSSNGFVFIASMLIPPFFQKSVKNNTPAPPSPASGSGTGSLVICSYIKITFTLYAYTVFFNNLCRCV